MLGVLGLTPHEEAVYRLMLGRPAVTAGEMATRAGLSEQVALRAIERMVGTG